ncbi:glycosyltransferase family 2 protein, partial [Rubrivirga sp.]|uniref:glycosyltransferase family 2 protein n=1 Tax=Rubrivirga sp. TaxID=1885344 RepID=UPI003C731681
MPSAPRVAIALPVYNGEAYLEGALEALCAQTELDWVALVTDNASTDATAEIVLEAAAADPRLRYSRNETNLGANGNFNRAMALAVETGARYAKWAAHDDVLHPAYLERCLAALDDRPDAVGAHSAIRLVDDDGGPYPFDLEAGGFRVGASDVWGWTPEKTAPLDGRDPARRLLQFLRAKLGEWMIYGVFRSDALAATRPFAMPGVEDALCAELLLRGPMLSVPDTLFDHRLHAGSARHLSRADYIEYETGSRPSGNSPSAGRAVEYARAIARVPLPTRHRTHALAALARFALSGRQVRNLFVPGRDNYFGLERWP